MAEKSHKILVVDDEPDLEQLMLQRMRREIRRGRYEFVFAGDGEEALQCLKAHPDIDVILSDINMPRMTGLELLEKVTGMNIDVHTVMVSAYGDIKNIRTAMNHGAFDFVIKPVDFEDLRVTLDRTISNLDVWREAVHSRNQLTKLKHDLRLAYTMQQSILPSKFPSSPHFHVYGNMKPAQDVGGDFYDITTLPDGRLAVAVADVSGKGVPAALFMMSSCTMLRGATISTDDPAEVLSVANDVLYQTNESTMFVTVFFAVYNPISGRLHYANGGHNHPVVIHADGTATVLPKVQGVALGVVQNFEYGSHDVILEPGDTVVLYTDGVTEAENAAAEQFEMERLCGLFANASPNSAEDTVTEVFRAVEEFAGDAPQFDDITCLVLHRRAAAADERRLSLTMPPELEEMKRVDAAIAEFGKTEGWTSELEFQIKLVFEEVVINVVNYGFETRDGNAGAAPEVGIDIDSKIDAVRMVIRDNGRAFDPLTQAPEPDTESEIPDRPIGGLGIYLVRELMDEVEYRREGDWNCLTMSKRRNG